MRAESSDGRWRHAAALVTVGVGIAVVLGGCAVDERASDAASPPAAVEDRGSAGPRSGALPDGGVSSCAEGYSPRAIARRAFAFDGTVADIGAGTTDRAGEQPLGYVAVTFTVHEWFRGGTTETVTVDMAPPEWGVSETELGGGSYGLGSRLLVSGEPRWGGPPLQDPIAWVCGFTRYYDTATADAWRTAAR